jgi:hypothetical protein
VKGAVREGRVDYSDEVIGADFLVEGFRPELQEPTEPVKVPEGTRRRPPPEELWVNNPNLMARMERAFVGAWWWQFGGVADASEVRWRVYDN